jgi:hypothetical protein
VTAVSDTSPLIALGSIGLLDLPPRLFERVQVPEAVAHDLSAKPSAAGVGVLERDWLHVVRLKPSGSFDLLIRLGACPGNAGRRCMSCDLGGIGAGSASDAAAVGQLACLGRPAALRALRVPPSAPESGP